MNLQFKDDTYVRVKLSFMRLAVILATFAITSPALANPEGGVVTAGSAVITQSPGNTVIQQSSDKAIINWNSFNISSGEKTQFVQPASSSVALNRIDPDQGASQIYGSLTANGHVILVNQAGIHFGPSATVDVAGLIASTANISDANFMAGNDVFDQPSTLNGSIINEGIIQAADHGLVALIGNNVENDGTIIAHGGNVILASGDTFAISFDDTDLVSFADNNGDTRTLGNGTIQVTPAAAQSIIDNTVDLSGVSQTQSATELNGNVILSSNAVIDVSGDSGGTALLLGGNTAVHGSILANATGSGNGGFIETSGTTLDTSGIQINTSTVNGNTGAWLLDPYNLYISTSGSPAASGSGTSGSPYTSGSTDSYLTIGTLEGALSSSSVYVQTTSGGSIEIDNGITWITASTLSLTSAANIYFNGSGATIMATSGTLSLSAVNGSQSITAGTIGGGTIAGGTVSSMPATISVANFILNQGQWYQSTNSGLPTFNVTGNFEIASGATYNNAFVAQFTRIDTSNSDNGIDDVFGLQGVATGPLGTNYVLDSNIDATVTSGWNSGAGFVPIGGSSSPTFTGSLNGQGYTINNLYENISVSSSSPIAAGLFGWIDSTVTDTIQNLGLTNVSLSLANSGSGASYLGGIAGRMETPATSTGVIAISNSYVTGTLTDNSSSAIVAGLIGYFGTSSGDAETIQTSYNAATVSSSGSGAYVGGFIGNFIDGIIQNVYNIGAITSSGGGPAGGIIAVTCGGCTISSQLNTSWNAGNISGNSGSAGALIGQNNLTSFLTFSNDFYDSQTSGTAGTNGVGFTNGNNPGASASQTTASMMSYSTFSSTWNITDTPSANSTIPNDTWYIFNNGTFPILLSELGTPGSTPASITITNAHQLQLMGSTLGASYTLANNIDLAATGDSATYDSDIWGGAIANQGFVPIGASSNFTGSFNGQSFTISNLYINSTSSNIGLFGQIGSSASVQQVILASETVNGAGSVGGLVGLFSGGTISNSSVSATVTATNVGSGVFVGGQSGGTISNSSSAGSVSSSGSSVGAKAGGFVGNMTGGTINDSYSTANVTYTGGGNAASGGFVGIIIGTGTTITNSWSSGAVSSNGSNTGGFAGTLFANGGLIATGDFSIGTVTMTASGLSNVGGFAGEIFNSTGTISNDYSTGYVSAGNASDVGGFAGGNLSSASVTNSYTISGITGTGSNVGGFFGTNSSTTNSGDFWIAAITGLSATGSGSAAGLTAGVFGGGGSTDMTQESTFTNAGWTFDGSDWAIINGESLPYLASIYTATPRAISGNSNLASDSTIQIAANGSNITTSGLVQGTTLTDANGFYYFLEPNSSVSGSIANLAQILVSSSTNNSYGITVAPGSNGSITGLTINSNTVSVGDNNTNAFSDNTTGNTLSSFLATYSSLPYSLSGNNLTIGTSGTPNISLFVNGSNTTYTLDGNITTYNGTGTGELTFSGPASLTANDTLTSANGGMTFDSIINGAETLSIANSSGAITLNGIIGGGTALTGLTIGTGDTTTFGASATGITTSGNQSFGSTLILGSNLTLNTGSGTGNTLSLAAVTGGGFGLTLETAGTGTQSGVISGTGTSLTFSGTGTFTLSQTNTYTGSTTINDGTLSATVANALGTNGAIDITPLASDTAILNISTLTSLGNNSALNFNSSAGVAKLNTSSTLSLSNDIDLTGTANTINVAANTTTLSGTITGTGGLAVTGSGTISFDNTIGTIASLSVAGNSIFGNNATTVTTAGSQSYTGKVTLNTSPTFTSTGGSGITFGSTVNGAQALSIANSSGTITFDSTVGNSAALTGLSIGTGDPTRINTTSIITSGNQNYNSPVTASTGATTLLLNAGGSMTLGTNGTITSDGNITLVDGTTFTNNAGTNALNPANGYRFLVWSVNPSNDSIGGLAYIFIQYNATYGVTTPSDSNPTDSGFLYSAPASANITLTSIAGILANGGLFSGGVYSLSAAGNLYIDGNINAGNNTLDLAAGTQQSGSIILASANAGTLISTVDISLTAGTGSYTGNIGASTAGFSILTQTPVISLTANNGNIYLSNTGALEIQSLSTNTASNVATVIAATGAITQSDAITTNGTASFSAGSNAITLNNSNNAFTGTVSFSDSGANNVSITDSGTLILGTLAIGGNLTATGSGSSNTLSLQTGSSQNWAITGANNGSVNGNLAFSNFQNLTGGTVADTFTFGSGGTLSGTITGGSGASAMNFSSYNSPVTVKISGNLSGSVLNNAGTTIANYQNIDSVTGNGSSALFTAPSIPSTVTITSSNGGTVNDPFTFSGFNSITAQGQTSIIFSGVTALLNLSSNQATINSQIIQFSGIDSYGGSYTNTSSAIQVVTATTSSSTTDTSDSAVSLVQNALSSSSVSQNMDTISQNQSVQNAQQAQGTHFGACGS